MITWQFAATYVPQGWLHTLSANTELRGGRGDGAVMVAAAAAAVGQPVGMTTGTARDERACGGTPTAAMTRLASNPSMGRVTRPAAAQASM